MKLKTNDFISQINHFSYIYAKKQREDNRMVISLFEESKNMCFAQVAVKNRTLDLFVLPSIPNDEIQELLKLIYKYLGLE